ncbi:MAG: hypothetical protein HC777_03260, partial [Hyphomonadaceae bacterium]|nr:hypothetical protein [Hyphomonadaceae bacterium]
MATIIIYQFWKVDHTKRHRPRWFAQGPLSMCLAYMLIRRCGPDYLQEIAWACLEYSRLKAITEQTYHPQAIYWDSQKLNEVMAGLSLSEEEIRNFKIAQEVDGFLARWRDLALRFASPEQVAMVGVPFAPGYLDTYAPHDAEFAQKLQEYRMSGLMYAAGFEV